MEPGGAAAVEGGAAAAAAAKVGWEDLLAALTQVGPSALRELELQVPRVSWDDIGGQHELNEAAEGPEGALLGHVQQQHARQKVHRLAVADGRVAVRVGVEQPT